MSPAAYIAIAVVALVALFAVVLLTAARKSDVRGAGALSRETRRRDKDAEIDGPAPTGKDVERAAVEAEQQHCAGGDGGPHRGCGDARESAYRVHQVFLAGAGFTGLAVILALGLAATTKAQALTAAAQAASQTGAGGAS